jgi:serine protease Do
MKKLFKFKGLLLILTVVIIALIAFYYFKKTSFYLDIETSISNDEPLSSYVESQAAIEEANMGDTAQTYDKSFSISSGFAELVNFVSPAVVNISAVKVVKNQGGDIPLDAVDPAFRELFKNLLPQQPTQKQRFISLGSGFVVRSDGFIVTNFHVIQDAETIQVTFDNGTKHMAVLYAKDEMTDIALLKIEAKNLPTLKLADSEKVRVGDWVIAIGNPYGLGGTVSAGIVSAKSRDINLGNYSDYIQTDTSINRGNSGGPLINTKGEVVGVNTAIFSTNGGSMGIGFSLTANITAKVVSQLITNKKVTRSWLGVQIQAIDTSMAEALSLENTDGALVASVVDTSPASEAGLKSGDIIIAINGNRIKNSRLLPKIISDIMPNTKVTLTIISNEQKKDVVVELKALPEANSQDPKLAGDKDGSVGNEKIKETTYEDVGIKVAEINKAIRKYFNLPETAKGIIILAVAQNSIAEQKGIVPGLRILSLNKKEVLTIEQLNEEMKKSNKLFLVEAINKNRLFITISKKEIDQGYPDSY